MRRPPPSSRWKKERIQVDPVEPRASSSLKILGKVLGQKWMAFLAVVRLK
jgi:hypothetical protein